MTTISLKPNSRARSTKPYWRFWLSWLCSTWPGDDWRTYTIARRPNRSVVSFGITATSCCAGYGWTCVFCRAEQQFDESVNQVLVAAGWDCDRALILQWKIELQRME